MPGLDKGHHHYFDFFQMVMADKDSPDATSDVAEVDGAEQSKYHQLHQCGSNSLASIHNGCIISEPHYHPWDQDHIVYVPMIPFGDTSTRTACIQVTGLQPVAPPTDDAGPSSDGERLTSNVESLNSASIKLEDDQEPEQSLPGADCGGAREMHNEIERKRRRRIKQCCDVLRRLVPGLHEKTDKATVLEHTVDFVDHLFKCPDFKCVCYKK